ncbi:putative nuclease HARBI1 [Acyrthosiphon pisum]|uniref:DDE Tnp4 domain-containing protein n=1 Tax=Acyrthosiphon pisum TaxID=7029 RepID=A0A8R2FCK3_ACYPI|nr:putative nuclease HARBI1 [Acyrthosiphon pisum]|eukprot:XP_008188998.1 PREDICTED: putative nuclease HARBI1 [Acyrthosiphon pisum]
MTEDRLSNLAILSIESNIAQTIDFDNFKGSFRVERSTAYNIVEKFENSIFFPRKNLNESSVTSENHILSFLWFSANKCCLRDVSERFGVGLTTQFRINNRVMDFLVDISATIINLNEGTVNLSREFQKVSGLPGVIGCIDGSSIPIRTPAHKLKSTYTNRHDMPSITLQAICDYKKKFIDVFTGAPGKIHDSRVFALSDISKELPLICENKYHIIGDGAYSIRDWLLVPYKNYGNLTDTQIKFNKMLCGTRVLIENSFGLLKSRFRQLLQVDIHDVDKITKFIISCCVLHNMCIDMEDYIELDNEILLTLAAEPNVYSIDSDTVLRKKGEAKREALKNSLQYFQCYTSDE